MLFRRNLSDRNLFAVEGVESVTEGALSASSLGKSCYPVSENYSTKVCGVSVGSVTKNDLQEYFSTLSTHMNERSVDANDVLNEFNINDLQFSPRIPQVQREKEESSIIFTNDEETRQLVFGWLRLVLAEGHIEASQQDVGRVVGWPSRNISVESLFVDFDLWCRKQGVSRWSVPGKMPFLSVLDEVLSRCGDWYAFPSLDECRAKFAGLETKYEST